MVDGIQHQLTYFLLSDSIDHHQYVYNAVVCYTAQVIAITI